MDNFIYVICTLFIMQRVVVSLHLFISSSQDAIYIVKPIHNYAISIYLSILISLLDIDIIYMYSSVSCESSSGGNNNNNSNSTPATNNTSGIIIGVVVALVVVIVVLVVVTAVVVGVKMKRNRSTHHKSTLYGPSDTNVAITCKYHDTSHHIQNILNQMLHLYCNTV